MSRNLKNIIMIILVITLISSIYLTLENVRKENIISNDNNSKFSLTSMKDIANGDMQKSPKEDINTTMENPPDKPEEKENNNQFDDKVIGNRNMPEDFKGHSKEIKLDSKYIILFGIENLFLSLIIIYLIMSKLNKKNFKETFENGDKVIILVLSLVILVVGLLVMEVYLMKNNSNEERKIPNDMEKTQKETLAEDVEAGKDIVENNIKIEKEFIKAWEDKVRYI